MAIKRSPDYGVLQRIVDDAFRHGNKTVSRLDVIVLGETYDLPADLTEILELLPPGTYTRVRLCQQINSSINGHAWGLVYGTVE